jgi:hypothetical protein
MDQHCASRLDDLLQGRHNRRDDDLDYGAQLVVTELDGTETFRALLARHRRIDDQDTHVLWIRPIHGGTPVGLAGLPVFNLSVCRRRGLAFISAAVSGDGDVVLTLASGQRAVIQPAAGPDLEALNFWDEFTLNVLSAEEELGLDRLTGDSWYGRFS